MNNTAGKPTTLQQRGALTEQLALDHLLEAGLRLLARNVRYKVGELDLVLADRGTLVFVEVRSRASRAWGGAAASIHADKRRRLVRAAQLYLQQHYGNRWPPCRFDVVLFEGNAAPEWLRNAFTPE